MSLSKGKLSWFFPSISSISSCKSVHLGVRAVVKFASEEDWLGFFYSLEDDTQLFFFFFVLLQVELPGKNGWMETCVGGYFYDSCCFEQHGIGGHVSCSEIHGWYNSHSLEPHADYRFENCYSRRPLVE